jgi:tripartite-type tricarboxylate transporter receptor subunit TctC
MRIRWALRLGNGTLRYGEADCLDWEPPKNGDVPRSPVPENGSLMPSAGTIFNLKSEIDSSSAEPPAPAFAVSVLGGHTMKLSRHRFLHLAVGAVALPAVSRIARAQAYPSRPVHIILGFAAGGGLDITARLIGQSLSERLDQQFVIENRTGANGNIATEAVVRSPPDGYTLLMMGGPNYDKLSLNLMRDIAPVAGVVNQLNVMLVNPSFPAKTIPEFIAYAKAYPSQINMGSAGIGSPNHLLGELFKTMTGVNMFHVPYRGGAPAITDLLSGQIQVFFAGVPVAIEYIRADRLRALGVTTSTRSAALPDIPTVGEFVQGYEASVWYGLGAPKNTPAEIVDKLNKEISAALADPRFKGRLAEGFLPMSMTAGQFSKFIADDTEKWGKVMRAANIKAQ